MTEEATGPGKRDLWTIFRKRIAPIALLVALVVLAARTCATEPVTAEIRFAVGGAGAAVRSLEVELLSEEGDEILGHYRHNHPRGSGPEAGRWTLTASPGTYLLAIEVATDRELVRAERRIELREGAVIRVDLERDLPAD